MPPGHTDAVRIGVRGSGLIVPGQRVVVALSGGPDSTALLLAVREEGHDVVAAHYDHALREGSELAAEHVAALCRRVCVELVSERRQLPMPRGSMQAGARSLRYDFLERARRETGAQVVATGHTADDLVEGVVMNLTRGCGLAGFRGMPARRGVFIRPLLRVWRSEVIAFLEQRGTHALEDPANTDTRFARVRVRRQVLPALERDRPGIMKRFHGAAMQVALLQDAVAGAAAQALAADMVDRALVAGASEPIAAELMRQLYARAGGAQRSLSRVHLESMLRLARPGRGGRGVDLPGGFRLRAVGGTMEMVRTRKPGGGNDRTWWHLDITHCEGCDDPSAAHLRSDVRPRLGFRTPGLRMRPLGGRGTRKLQDMFVDSRVPREERDGWPLVFVGERLAWVPGVAIDSDLASDRGTPALHVTVTRILPEGDPMLESQNSPSGNPS